jgi:nucleotide-binding universal stress UspA family protein
LRAEAVALLESVRDTAGLDGAQLFVVPDTSPSRGLKAFAAEQSVDLVVVGSSHRGSVGRVVLGDTGHAVLHGAPCPVLVAPAGFAARSTRPATIGVAFNGSPEAELALEMAVTLTQALGAQLAVAEVLEVGAIPDTWGYQVSDYLDALAAPAQKRLDEFVAALPVPATGSLLQGPVHLVLREFARHVDLMVCGSRGWGPAARLAFGSTAQKLMHHAPGLVLVVPRGASVPGAEPSEQAPQEVATNG